jgi:glycine betaine/proline transport system ATP-binding protein
MTDIKIRNVSKIFGGNWETALAMTQQGADKGEVLAKTGCSVGLDNVSLDIAAAASSSSWACRAPANRRWCATSTG